MDLGFAQKNVLITGGTKNVGKGIARAFLEEGANVICTYKEDVEAAERAYEELKSKAKANLYMLQADACNEADVERTFAFCEEKFGFVDILVNNASRSGKKSCEIKDMTNEFWNEEVSGVFTPALLHTRQMCLRCLDGDRAGKILSISAAEGVKICSEAGRSAYGAANAGIDMFTRTLAYQMAPHNININSLQLGRVLAQEEDESEYRYISQHPKMGPLEKPASADDIGKIAAFLCSDYARYIVGANLDATGGLLL